MTHLNRRNFLRAGLAGTALAVLPQISASAAVPVLAQTATNAGAGAGSAGKRKPRRAQNVIFMVSDGMSHGTLTMAERFLRRHQNRGSYWFSLYDRADVRRALMDTASASSLVTDSAAASSAWGCGQRVNNGSINYSTEGRPLTPILHLARAAGMATGLVTTATITHATPAGFGAQATERAAEDDIAKCYLEARIDVLLGGGRRFFDPKTRADRQDLAATFAAAGYALVRESDALRTVPAAGPLLGLFAESHLPFSIDRQADAGVVAKVPTLRDMTRVALNRLSRAGDGGFILQIEGARIDHAAHANDVGGLIFDQIAFDETVGLVLEFLAEREDTLFILTSDHGNSNPGLNGMGAAYSESGLCFDRVAKFRQSNVWALSGLGPESTAAAVRDRLEASTALVLNAEEVELIRRALRNEHREGFRVRNDPLIACAQVLSNYTGVGWTGVSHTADFTELVAFGPGSEALRGLVKNSALFGVMTSALGLKV